MKPAQAAIVLIAICGFLGAASSAVMAQEARVVKSPRLQHTSKITDASTSTRAERRLKKQALREEKKAEKSAKAAKTTQPEKLSKAVLATTATLATPDAATFSNRLQSQAEARLIAVYQFIGQGRSRDALRHAETLVQDYPNFQLAQLVYGDLLSSRSGSAKTVQNLPSATTAGVPGDVPDSTAQAAGTVLADLRLESRQRLRALREPAPAGLVPSQFLSLSAQNRHAIAVDASRSRLYLFENTPSAGLRLVADFYVSVGKSGLEKTVEGDLRTPLGVYYITSNLNPKLLKDLYGAGALPINYPNPLDLRRGKTGSGIWLHGVPAAQFARAPLATDGCIALSNPDLQRLLSLVAIRTTPVVIAKSLQWVTPAALKSEASTFQAALQNWHSAKSSGDMPRLASLYAPDFSSRSKNRDQWLANLQAEIEKQQKQAKKEKTAEPDKRDKNLLLASMPASRFQTEIKDVSFLRWSDTSDTMVATFGELAPGQSNGRTVRQYWSREPGGSWKIFFEAVI